MRLVMVVTAVAAAAVVAIMIVIIMTCLLSPSFVLKKVPAEFGVGHVGVVGSRPQADY